MTRLALVEDTPRALDARVAPPDGFTFTLSQATAADLVSTLLCTPAGGLAVIAGWAGTGKTTLTRAVVNAWPGRFVLLAPTGRAARRLAEATGRRASTIHRWMYQPIENPKTGAVTFRLRGPVDFAAVTDTPCRTCEREPHDGHDLDCPAANRLTGALVIVDEASMVGPTVWADFLRVVGGYPGLRALLVGDDFQLPPVLGPDETRKFPSFRPLVAPDSPAVGERGFVGRAVLTDIMRQALDSPIIAAATAIREGRPVGEVHHGTGFYHRTGATLADVMRYAERLAARKAPIIVHTNAERCAVNGTIRALSRAFPGADPWPATGEPIVVIRNCYEAGVVNGETGEVVEWLDSRAFGGTARLTFGAFTANVRRARVRFADGEVPVTLVRETFGVAKIENQGGLLRAAHTAATGVPHGEPRPPVVLADYGWSYTCHKSQGCEHPEVFVYAGETLGRGREEDRRWLYTACTRARESLWLLTHTRVGRWLGRGRP